MWAQHVTADLPPQVVLSFYEKRVRQQWGLSFGKQEERLFWEQWCACILKPALVLVLDSSCLSDGQVVYIHLLYR